MGAVRGVDWLTGAMDVMARGWLERLRLAGTFEAGWNDEAGWNVGAEESTIGLASRG
jgi:hypothetical protein